MTEKENTGMQKLTEEEIEQVTGGAMIQKPITSLTCEKCGQRFKTMTDLRQHQNNCPKR